MLESRLVRDQRTVQSRKGEDALTGKRAGQRPGGRLSREQGFVCTEAEPHLGETTTPYLARPEHKSVPQFPLTAPCFWDADSSGMGGNFQILAIDSSYGIKITFRFFVFLF